MNPPIQPLRVLQVVSGDLWAGAEAQVAALLAHLVTQPGLALHAAVLNPGELADRLRVAGVAVTILDESRLSPVAIFGGLRRLIRAFAPAVVHTHRSKENVLGSLAARLEGRRPSLRTVHGAPEHDAPWWRPDKNLYRALDDFAARRWQAVSVAVSDDLARVLARDFPCLSIDVIHNGLDAAVLQPLRARHLGRVRGHAGDVCRVAFLGRLVPVKRVDLFLNMVAALAANRGLDWRADIIGDGPLLPDLQAQAGQLGLADRVTFRGFRPDATSLLADCDALVFTSDHEGTPMAALESLAVGVPVVARAVGGLVELLEGLEGCALVDGDDPARLAQAVATLAVKEKGSVVTLPLKYHIETCSAAYESLYRRLAGR